MPRRVPTLASRATLHRRLFLTWLFGMLVLLMLQPATAHGWETTDDLSTLAAYGWPTAWLQVEWSPGPDDLWIRGVRVVDWRPVALLSWAHIPLAVLAGWLTAWRDHASDRRLWRRHPRLVPMAWLWAAVNGLWWLGHFQHPGVALGLSTSEYAEYGWPFLWFRVHWRWSFAWGIETVSIENWAPLAVLAFMNLPMAWVMGRVAWGRPMLGSGR